MLKRKKLIREIRVLHSAMAKKIAELELVDSSGDQLLADLFEAGEIFDLVEDRPKLHLIKGGKGSDDGAD